MAKRMKPVDLSAVPPNGPAPKRRITTSAKAPQAKVRDPDKWGIAIYRCSRCEIDYKVRRNARPSCPLCEEQSKQDLLRDELKKTVNANELLKRDLAKARSQLTVLDGMREAVSELEDADMMFLKELVYRYRKDDTIRVSQLTRKRRIEVPGAGVAYREEVCGWRVHYRDVDPPESVEHAASSIGGAMIALQFSEALKLTGLRGAMDMLHKALSRSMANADAS